MVVASEMGGGSCEVEEARRMDCEQSTLSSDFQVPASLCKPLPIKVGGPSTVQTPTSFAAFWN